MTNDGPSMKTVITNRYLNSCNNVKNLKNSFLCVDLELQCQLKIIWHCEWVQQYCNKWSIICILNSVYVLGRGV